jgi:hypothetical protein
VSSSIHPRRALARCAPAVVGDGPVLPMAECTQQLAVDDAAESCVEERGGLLRTAATVAAVVGRLLVV